MDSKDKKVKKAKHIIALIFNLVEVREPKGNHDLNKATDAMYDYVKTIQEN